MVGILELLAMKKYKTFVDKKTKADKNLAKAQLAIAQSANKAKSGAGKVFKRS